MTRLLLAAAVALLGLAPAAAQTFPERGRQAVVDAANVIPADVEAQLSEKLVAFERDKGQQFVVATVPSLEGRTIEDYGYRLGRAWGIGREGVDDGVILLVAPAERKVRIEVGYGLTPVLTAQLSGLIIRETILPRFRNGDMPGGIVAGADAVLEQVRLPAPEAEARAARILAERGAERDGPNWGPLVFWLVVIVVILGFIIAGAGRRGGGKRYRRGRAPVVIWGPGWGSGGGSSWGGGGFGSGGGSGSFGGGGFSGGGGSFGGGGASGGW